MPGPSPDRVLIVSLDNIGDLVFASSVLTALQSAWSDARFSVWCKDYARDIASLLPGAPRIYAADPVWDRAPGREPGRWGPFLHCLRSIRQDRYDVAVITSRQWRASFATRLTGAATRVGFAGGKRSPWLTQRVERPAQVEPVVVELGRLVKPLVGSAPMATACYRLVSEPLAPLCHAIEARRRQHTAISSRPYVALHAFAGHPRRCLPLDVWVAFAKHLEGRGLCPLWVGTPAELERINTFADTRNHEHATAYGSGRLLDTAALIAGAIAFVGHDSGPLHIASALGTPCLGLYLPGEPQRTQPQGTARSVTIVRSSPVGLGADEVMAAFMRLMGD